MSVNRPILLILDLDETLIHSRPTPLERSADFNLGQYHVYYRPHLKTFLSQIAKTFHLAIWSSGSEDYVSVIVGQIMPEAVRSVFVWSRSRCIPRTDLERHEGYFVKDLKKVERLGYNLDRILIVEDMPKNVERNYGNAIYIRPFLGESTDEELPRLARYLRSIHTIENVRRLEKRIWRGKYLSREP